MHTRVGFLEVQIEGALQPDIKRPAGEEVVAIGEALRAMELKVREPYAIGLAATECPGPVLLAMQAKALQGLPAPAQQGLEDLVQMSQVGVAGDQNSSPDQGTDAVEHQAELVDGVSLCTGTIIHPASLPLLCQRHRVTKLAPGI